MLKRNLSILLLSILLFILPACGNNNREPEESNYPEATHTEIDSDIEINSEKTPASGAIEEFEENDNNSLNNLPMTEMSPKPEATKVPNNASPGQSQDAELNIASPNGSTEYERYLAMSGDEQQAFFESFGDPAAFFAWLNNARAEYEALYPGIDVGDGVIDLNDYIVSGN